MVFMESIVRHGHGSWGSIYSDPYFSSYGVPFFRRGLYVALHGFAWFCLLCYSLFIKMRGVPFYRDVGLVRCNSLRIGHDHSIELNPALLTHAALFVSSQTSRQICPSSYGLDVSIRTHVGLCESRQ